MLLRGPSGNDRHESYPDTLTCPLGSVRAPTGLSGAFLSGQSLNGAIAQEDRPCREDLLIIAHPEEEGEPKVTLRLP